MTTTASNAWPVSGVLPAAGSGVEAAVGAWHPTRCSLAAEAPGSVPAWSVPIVVTVRRFVGYGISACPSNQIRADTAAFASLFGESRSHQRSAQLARVRDL